MNLTDMKEILTSRIRAYLAVPEAQESADCPGRGYQQNQRG